MLNSLESSNTQKKIEIKVPRIVSRTADTIKPERTRWLWDGWIPLRAITFIAGVEGLGKSTYALHFAARLTRGQLAGEYFGKPVNVSLYTTEDDPQSIIVPRLLAAGASQAGVSWLVAGVAGVLLLSLSSLSLFSLSLLSLSLLLSLLRESKDASQASQASQARHQPRVPRLSDVAAITTFLELWNHHERMCLAYCQNATI